MIPTTHTLPTVLPQQYTQQLQDKTAHVRQLFASHYSGEITTFSSPPSHYRMRAEFRLWHKEGQLHYAMHDPVTRQPILLTAFPVACEKINQLMSDLLPQLAQQPRLQQKVFQAEFHAATTGQAMITLAYHRPLDDAWERAAQTLATVLGVSIIGRSRGQKRVVGQDYVTECFSVDGDTFWQRQPEGNFSQPNAAVNAHMLHWAKAHCPPTNEKDLLELYCGNGNFTLPLSRCFRRVLATEVSKTAVHAALHNREYNHCHNISVVRLSSEELTQALQGTRPFRRLANIDLNQFQFDTALVDPPRAGLDEATRQLITSIPRILYISCNPETLLRDVAGLQATHRVETLALFDQFPYTHHVECGVVLLAH